jgi:hypothetical protein
MSGGFLSSHQYTGISRLGATLHPAIRYKITYPREDAMKPVELYVCCAACLGHDRVPERPLGPRTQLCPTCRGKGLMPTEDGRIILGLLKAVEGHAPDGP